MFPVTQENPFDFPLRFPKFRIEEDDSNNTVAIDWETYYEAKTYSLSLMSPINYVHDARFYPYLVAIEGNINGKEISYCGRPEKFDWSQLTDNAETIRFLAHNASFDEIVTWRYLEMNNLMSLQDATERFNFMCTADLAAYLKYPRNLAGLSYALRLPMPDKSIRDRMSGVDYTIDANLTEEVLDYAAGDARNCFNAWFMLREQWPDTEREFSIMNRRRCYRGVPIDIEKAKEAADTLARVKFEAEAGIPYDWEGNKTPLSLAKMAEQCRQDKIPVPTSFAEGKCETWEATYSKDVRWVGSVRDWRKANTHQKRIQRMRDQFDDETGFMHYAQLYCGAHTGRSSGSGGMNMQNIPSGNIVGDINVRNLFHAPPGYVIMVADYDQIEPRLLYHRAGMNNVLDLVRNGMHIYEAHARATMGYSHPKPLKETDADMYRTAKFRVIGLGYGCGAATFHSMCPFMSETAAKEAVFDYRRSHIPIVDYWYEHEKWLQLSARDLDPDYTFRLMSGRDFSLYNPRVEILHVVDQNGNENSREVTRVEKIKNGSRTQCWGGTVTENEIQGTGMDILKEGITNLPEELAKYWLFDTHDEAVFCLPESDYKDMGDEILKCMTTISWLPDDFPLEAGADYVKMYDKL